MKMFWFQNPSEREGVADHEIGNADAVDLEIAKGGGAGVVTGGIADHVKDETKIKAPKIWMSNIQNSHQNMEMGL